mmetsp:Transcript_75384/g.135824  ORF Transcript_75384/g.135824 Transcript_75384/m.135824 type:complete len:177 (-) Transcript_75384:18-548(-)
MAMLVSSFATPTSWAEVAASAEASLAQRELQKAATSTEKIVPEDFPKPPRLPPSSVPDNDLGPGQYTCTESLIRRTVSCARFGKAERFRKEREENVANSIANWADQLSPWDRPLPADAVHVLLSRCSLRNCGNLGVAPADCGFGLLVFTRVAERGRDNTQHAQTQQRHLVSRLCHR